MSDLRNPSLRDRDIRKLIELKSSLVKWDKVSNEKNEWVYISEEEIDFQSKLSTWLASKIIAPENECIIFNDSFSESLTTTWKDIAKKNEAKLRNKNVSVYDIDLKWVLQFSSLGVARFGRYSLNEKT